MTLPRLPFSRQPLRHVQDRIATGLITAGGIGVLLAILAIGVFLVWETLPLLAFSDTLPLAKLSPLAWGTLKAALAAMLFATPIALGAAMYSALFMSARLRSRLKPTLELMEAVPGVVVGFIAGLLLAPWVERNLASTLMIIIWLPLSAALAGYLWYRTATWVRRRLPLSWAGLWLIPWLAGMALLAMWLAPIIEQHWFGGDLRRLLDQRYGLDYATRNALIVGIAMGFAVIPSIYSLAEDALADVPSTLMEGAQALGASRWQALWKVALPTAAPGVFSAVMIGAGRAVGETMIVLMASGNTALFSASPFEGLRSLSASIAIELPEASPGGLTYHLLILAALALFIFTFVVNTLAEIVRQRLRRRYQRLGSTL
ncbi:ABC transporter permease subunit [Halomonas sp. TD01]|uniref:ABC transporter permease subunit n=1 Tax=Halomonas sp. TD01 TaxID=999141 RepID=UPI000214F560|nr:ABC transporter permease subunit [Halomonas sp. TD01]EGP19640.1 ABC transporter permease [Halomonas sp. TD01]CAH1042760.1 Phosphate ABC transporter, permease protein PstC (TC 3.A.1.7.1) [Halomonas sp. TD01]